MNSIFASLLRHSLAGVALAIATTLAAAQPGAKVDRKTKAIPLTAATMIIEYNSSAEDIGVQFFLDLSEGWQEMEIFDPSGQEIFGAETQGRLTRQGGGTELFLESVEPPIADLPFAKFFRTSRARFELLWASTNSALSLTRGDDAPARSFSSIGMASSGAEFWSAWIARIFKSSSA